MLFYWSWNYFKRVWGLCVVTQGWVTHTLTHRLRGIWPFSQNLLLIFSQADAFPDPSLDPVLDQPCPGVCPRTHRKTGRTEKGKERRVWVRGTRQIWTRCFYACDSAFRNWPEMMDPVTSPPLHTFWPIFILDAQLLYIPRRTINVHRCVAGISHLLSITLFCFLTYWVINI